MYWPLSQLKKIIEAENRTVSSMDWKWLIPIIVAILIPPLAQWFKHWLEVRRKRIDDAKKPPESSPTPPAVTADRGGVASGTGDASATGGSHSPIIKAEQVHTGDVHHHHEASAEVKQILAGVNQLLTVQQSADAAEAIRKSLEDSEAKREAQAKDIAAKDERIQQLEAQLAERQTELAGASDLQTAVVRLFNAALDKQKAGHLEAAIAFYSGAIELDPKYAVAYNNRGAAKDNLKRYEDALSDYDKAIELDPKNAVAYYNRGLAKANLKRYEDALSDYDKAIELDPKYAVAYYNRGNAKANLKRYEDALSDYDKAIELDPKNAVAYYNRGLAKANLKRYEDALFDYDKGIELDPKYAVAYNNRGNAKANLKRYEDALSDYDKAIELDPKDPAPFFNLACLSGIQGGVDTAIEWYRKALDIDQEYREARWFDDTDFDPIRDTPEFVEFRKEFEIPD